MPSAADARWRTWGKRALVVPSILLVGYLQSLGGKVADKTVDYLAPKLTLPRSVSPATPGRITPASSATGSAHNRRVYVHSDAIGVSVSPVRVIAR